MRGLLTFTALSLFCAPLLADPVYLVESESPYTHDAFELEGIVLLDLETGAIPTSVAKPQVGFGLFDWLQLSANTTLALFLDAPAFRIAELELAARAAIPPLASGKLSLYPYARIHGTLGQPYSVTYQGSLELVHTVISQHGDPGLDLIAGVAGEAAFDFMPQGFGLLFSADYARTVLRGYNPAFDTEGHKNRLFLNLVPTYSLGSLGGGSFSLDIAAQNRFTIWMVRGFMYDLLLQTTIPIGSSLSATVGLSIPVVGGRVFKAFLVGRYTHQFSRRDEIRITVEGVHFPPDSAVLFGPENEKSKENERILNRLYRKLSRYPQYSIVIEGHTSFVYWNDPVKGPAEQKHVLIPLSQARAESVMEALIDRGLERHRMRAVGKGGSEPVVPFSKKDEQWKNRRVEVHLYRE